MFYKPGDPPPLPHNPFKSLVVPRPIGWISTISREGKVNLAPYSFYNAVGDDPPMVMFSTTGPHSQGPLKDSRLNAEETGEFVVNLASHDLREQMNQSAAHVDREVDEMALAGLEAAPSVLVKPPRVKAAAAHLECRYLQTVELPCWEEGNANSMVIGEVVGIHIRDDMIVDGRVDIARIRPIARMGYMDYAVVNEVFSMRRPR